MATTLRKKIIDSTEFGQLREAGIRLFELLTGRIYNDYNSHDAGVTILEACIYALTELDFKAEQPVQDLLKGSGNLHSPFFTPSHSLYNKPVTINDLRKILIDIYGISNSWFAEQEFPTPLLFSDTVTKVINMTGGDLLRIKGVLDVFIELSSFELSLVDPSIDFSDTELNGNILRAPGFASFPVPGGVENYFVEFAFPYWESFPISWQSSIIINSLVVSGGIAGIVYNAADDVFSAAINIQYNTTQSATFGVIVKMTPFYKKTIPLGVLQTHIHTILTDTTLNGLIQRLNKKVVTITKSIRGVHETLEENRNLGTIYNSVDAARMQEIAINADIKISESVNPEELVTNFFLNVERFLSPLPEAYSEFELRSDFNQASDEIYNGPLLNNGFLLDKSLTDWSGNTVLYASDLLHAMTGEKLNAVPNTYKVLSFSFSSYLNNYIIADPSGNCLTLPNSERYRPRLSVLKSRIRIFKEGSVKEVQYDKSKVDTDFIALNIRSIKRVELHHIEKPGIDDIGMPPDNDYYSIQHDFPVVYGIGKGSLSLTALPDRVAKSRQLKAYLLFFEQLLANHNSHLNNLHQVLSLDPDLPAMSPAMPLYNVPGIAPLLVAFLNSFLTFENFINDTSNNYVKKINDAAEIPALHFKRRERYLDHLLARFGEDLTSYSAFMLSKKYIDPSQVILAKQSSEYRIIQDKLAMLNEVATLQGDRSLGADFTKFIFLNEINPGQFRWEIRDPNNDEILLRRNTVAANALASFNDIFNLLNALLKRECFVITPIAPHQVTLVQNPPAGVVSATSLLTFPTLPAANAHIDKIVNLTQIIWNSNNVSGLEKKVARQTGIQNYTLRSLVSMTLEDHFIFGFDGFVFNFSMPIEGFANPLRSANTFAALAPARNAADLTVKAGINLANYSHIVAGPVINIQISDGTGLLAILQINNSPGVQVNKIFEQLAVFFNRRFASQEGFCLIEHVTLLPRVTTLLGVLDKDAFLSNPYLYQVSIIIPDGKDSGLLSPGYQNRLSDPDFQTHLEKQFQKECPAHIYPFFIYPDGIGIAAFHGHYIRWRLWKHIINNNLTGLDFVQSNLVQWLNTIIPKPKHPLYIN